mmetsp:Transcript_20115/g.19418  ORF Transcript_20115/g.19418 Transcript_20115/m.19418 type:complete len:160 (+) Transcript_20115:86-565(+)
MGNLCNCMTLQPDTSGSESAPLIVRDVEMKSTQGDSERGAKYYQKVIDDANKKFISSSNRHRVTMGTGVDELRAKLQNAVVDSSLVNSSGLKPSPSSGSRSNRTVEIMSEPVDISIIDAAADEMAELVSNHTFNFRMEDTFNSTVVSFKPVVGTISSSN